MLRLAWLATGWFAIFVGLLALALPLIPTTPFLVLATVCFARSSPRIHDWLVEHPRLGPPIRDWREHGAIGWGVKLATVAGFLGTPGLSLVLGAPHWMVAVQAAVGALAISFVLSRPSAPDAAGRAAEG